MTTPIFFQAIEFTTNWLAHLEDADAIWVGSSISEIIPLMCSEPDRLFQSIARANESPLQGLWRIHGEMETKAALATNGSGLFPSSILNLIFAEERPVTTAIVKGYFDSLAMLVALGAPILKQKPYHVSWSSQTQHYMKLEQTLAGARGIMHTEERSIKLAGVGSELAEAGLNEIAAEVFEEAIRSFDKHPDNEFIHEARAVLHITRYLRDARLSRASKGLLLRKLVRLATTRRDPLQRAWSFNYIGREIYGQEREIGVKAFEEAIRALKDFGGDHNIGPGYLQNMFDDFQGSLMKYDYEGTQLRPLMDEIDKLRKRWGV